MQMQLLKAAFATSEVWPCFKVDYIVFGALIRGILGRAGLIRLFYPKTQEEVLY